MTRQRIAYQTIDHGNILTLFAEMPADLETPVTAYLKLAHRSSYAFLFESVDRVEKWGRYSFLAADPESILWGNGHTLHRKEGRKERSWTSSHPLEDLQQEIFSNQIPHVEALPPFQGGYVGYLAYDCVRFFEKLPALLPARKDAPTFLFMKIMQLVVFDNLLQKMLLIVHSPCGGRGRKAAERAGLGALHGLMKRLLAPLPRLARSLQSVRRQAPQFRSEFTEAEYMAQVECIKSYIRAGDVFQTVLSTELESKGHYDPISLYRVLRTVNPSPYLYLLKLDSFAVVGSSPEIMVRKAGREAIVRPIAGTRQRGRDRGEDLAMEAELSADPKENAEHIMLVDLGRNDLGRVCEAGTIRVLEDRVVERYSHVMHLVSSVSGILKQGKTLFDLLAATFPAGTLSGAPKIRAMEIIEELEKSRRGIYGGSVGYIGFDGNMDMAITIRTMIVDKQHVRVRAGAGIVADSDPRLEYKECLNKARALMAVCEQLKRK